MSRQLQATSLSHHCVPRAIRALDGLPDDSASALERWLDALSALPFNVWVAVGQACARDLDGRRQRVTSSTLLDAIVADQQIELATWFIRDMVQTAAYAATTAASRAPRSAQRDFAAARAAADRTALAIATQTWLPPADREALCAPFIAVLGNSALRLV